MSLDVHYSSETVEWETPPELFAELDAEFGFTCDVCATPDKAKCQIFYTPEMDGLRQEWTGTCFMNPPYGREISKWVKKAHTSAMSGATVVCLLPARTDTRWFHEFCGAGEIRFLKGRVYFCGPTETDEPRAPFPSMVVIFHAYLDPASIVRLGNKTAMPLFQPEA